MTPMSSPISPITIVRKANQRAPLSPGQRALLKILKQVGYFLLTTLVAQAPQLAQLLSGKPVALDTALIAQVIAGVLQIIAVGLDKYLSAQGDTNYSVVKNTTLEVLLNFYKQFNGQSAPSVSQDASQSALQGETQGVAQGVTQIVAPYANTTATVPTPMTIAVTSSNPSAGR